MITKDMFAKALPEHNICSWGDCYSLYDHGTLFRQRFCSIQEVKGFSCLTAYYQNGIIGYLPPSELGIEEPTENDLYRLLCMSIPVQIIDVIRNPDEKLVILSRRLAMERLYKRFWNAVSSRVLEEGDIIKGTILTPAIPKKSLMVEAFGNEVEISPDELYWDGWIYPWELQERYPIYSDADMKITKLDLENKKLELSLKRVKINPWENGALQKYQPNSVHKGVVVNSRQYRLFVRFDDGIVCVCKGDPKKKKGDKLPVIIKKVNIDTKKVTGEVLN